jgi:hypothetical protein
MALISLEEFQRNVLIFLIGAIAVLMITGYIHPLAPHMPGGFLFPVA